MAEDFWCRTLLKEVLSLTIRVDSFLDEGPYSIEKALTLRHHLYDIVKRLETAPPSPGTEGLTLLAARVFGDLQDRLKCQNG